MEIAIQVYENSELIDSLVEDAESINILVKETLKTNKKHNPSVFEKHNGDTWVIFKKDNNSYRLEFSYKSYEEEVLS